MLYVYQYTELRILSRFQEIAQMHKMDIKGKKTRLQKWKNSLQIKINKKNSLECNLKVSGINSMDLMKFL